MSGSIHNLQAKRRLQAKKNAMINNTHKVYAHSDFHATITAVTTITSKEYKSKDLLVPRAGIEPARLAARDFESRASTNSATWACWITHYCIIAISLL